MAGYRATLPSFESQYRQEVIALAILVGLLAAPLAPVAKDLSTALATAVNTLQLVNK